MGAGENDPTAPILQSNRNVTTSHTRSIVNPLNLDPMAFIFVDEIAVTTLGCFWMHLVLYLFYGSFM